MCARVTATLGWASSVSNAAGGGRCGGVQGAMRQNDLRNEKGIRGENKSLGPITSLLNRVRVGNPREGGKGDRQTLTAASLKGKPGTPEAHFKLPNLLVAPEGGGVQKVGRQSRACVGLKSVFPP